MSVIQRIQNDTMGFITSPDDLQSVVAENRLQMVLVRCGNGRFLCPAQDAKHFMDMVEKSDDYVRDISLKWSFV